jgi:hypothetical protein
MFEVQCEEMFDVRCKRYNVLSIITIHNCPLTIHLNSLQIFFTIAGPS